MKGIAVAIPRRCVASSGTSEPRAPGPEPRPLEQELSRELELPRHVVGRGRDPSEGGRAEGAVGHREAGRVGHVEDLQAQLQGTGPLIITASNEFTRKILTYNKTIQTFPNNLLAPCLGLTRLPYLQPKDADELPSPAFSKSATAPLP